MALILEKRIAGEYRWIDRNLHKILMVALDFWPPRADTIVTSIWRSGEESCKTSAPYLRL